MNTDASDSTPLQSEPGSVAALWIGWIGAPAWWLAQFELRYAAVSHACADGHRWLVAVIGIAALVVALGLVAWSGWKLRGAAPSGRFIRIGGTALAAVFAGLVLLQLVPDLFLDPCRS
jgi:hypothetical protein